MTDEELSEMSDKWLDELIKQREAELRELIAEHDRRRRPDTKNLHTAYIGPLHEGRGTSGPFSLAQLEDAVHRFGDVHGFDAYVLFYAGGAKFVEKGESRNERT